MTVDRSHESRSLRSCLHLRSMDLPSEHSRIAALFRFLTSGKVCSSFCSFLENVGFEIGCRLWGNLHIDNSSKRNEQRWTDRWRFPLSCSRWNGECSFSQCLLPLLHDWTLCDKIECSQHSSRKSFCSRYLLDVSTINSSRVRERWIRQSLGHSITGISAGRKRCSLWNARRSDNPSRPPQFHSKKRSDSQKRCAACLPRSSASRNNDSILSAHLL